MKKFIYKIMLIMLLSSLFVGTYCYVSKIATAKYYGANTADQISMSFANSVKSEYNCYFLGNSRIYRSINPDKFSSVHAYNFAHDNDSYNQMYYKLLYLIENNEPIEYLIIGTDYFQFSFLSDTRNYVYSSYFPKDYQEDFGEKSWLERKKDYYTNIWTNRQSALVACLQLLCNKPSPDNINYQKENGQYVALGSANPDEVINRDYSVLDIQLDYFRKIISLCEKEDIDLFVIMPPLWSGEIKFHTDEERDTFNEMILDELRGSRYEGNYINYSEENGLSSYEDFIDITHLNPEASDRFSEYINEKIFGVNRHN